MPTIARLLLPALALACAAEAPKPTPADGPPEDGPPAWCAGATQQMYAPATSTELELFPDGLLQAEDASSPTGFRLDAARAAWPAHVPDLLIDGIATMNDLSGFGTMGGAVIRFDGPITGLPASADESVTSEGWQIIDVDALERVPYEATALDGDRTVRLMPLRPLRKGARHAVVVTTAATTPRATASPRPRPPRRCSTASPRTSSPRLAPRFRAALADLGLDPADISALSVFTTQDDGDTIAAVAAQEAEAPVSWTSEPDCVDRRGIAECTSPSPSGTAATRWGWWTRGRPGGGRDPRHHLAAGFDTPLPVVVYGHGLGSTGTRGWRIMRELDPRFALVAMEAVQHGEHPSNVDGSSQAEDAMAFLGITLIPPTVNPRVMRGNFNQTVLDRLRLIRLIREQPDLDGDGVDELDGSTLGYLGISLGAILGPELLVLDGAVDGAVFTVGGARLMSIATESSSLGQYADLLVALVGSEERFDRLAVAAQHMVDPVDPGAWAPHLLQDRLDDQPAPHLLVQIGMYDDVVPPASGHALARAVGAPHLEPVVEPVDLLEVIPEGPVRANGPDGATTAFFQFDQVTRGGNVGPAYHVATPESDEGKLQLETFIDSYLEEGVPVILDPYAALAGDD